MVDRKITVVHTVPDVATFIAEKMGTQAKENSVEVIHEVCPNYLKAMSLQGTDLDDLYLEFSNHMDSLLYARDAVLVTCSSLGNFVDRYKSGRELGLFRVDEPMMHLATESGGKIGLVVTNETTVEPSTSLLRRAAVANGTDIAITCLDCRETVSNLVIESDPDQVEKIRQDLEKRFKPFDSIVLAQVSIGKIFEKHSFGFEKLVLKSYDSGIKPVLIPSVK